MSDKKGAAEEDVIKYLLGRNYLDAISKTLAIANSLCRLDFQRSLTPSTEVNWCKRPLFHKANLLPCPS